MYLVIGIVLGWVGCKYKEPIVATAKGWFKK